MHVNLRMSMVLFTSFGEEKKYSMLLTYSDDNMEWTGRYKSKN